MLDPTNFNNYANEFLTKMRETFPNESKIMICHNMFSMMKMASKESTVNLFMSSLERYGTLIMTKDDAFFVPDGTPDHMATMLGFDNYWLMVDDTIKGRIWEYFQGMYIIGMTITGKEEELKRIVSSIQHAQ